VSITLAFIGHADPSTAARASAYEDAVLTLLTDHGSRVLARGRALPGQDPSLPYEVHLIWFPDRDALNWYMEDPRRHALRGVPSALERGKHGTLACWQVGCRCDRCRCTFRRYQGTATRDYRAPPSPATAAAVSAPLGTRGG
jgi:uncharacterized protein (DUF1330 family)